MKETRERQITRLPAGALSEADRAAWRSIQQRHRELDSPLFSPEFTGAVAAVRPETEVARINSAGTPVAYWAFHREGGVARPQAGSFTDFQGLVAAPGFTCDSDALLDACDLRAWQFDHLLTSQSHWKPFHLAAAASPYIDLADGFEAYREERRRAGSDELREALRKTRKIARDVAPLRFEPYCDDARVFAQLIQWKREQLRHRGLPDSFAPPWVLPFLQHVWRMDSGQVRGMLSAVFVGDELLAANLGVRSARVLHGWVTAFNGGYRKFSPGLILIAQLAQAAESLGIERIDMGKGNESFKKSFASGAIEIAEGAVDRRVLARAAARGWQHAKSIVQGTRWETQARELLRQWRTGAWKTTSARTPSE